MRKGLVAPSPITHKKELKMTFLHVGFFMLTYPPQKSPQKSQPFIENYKDSGRGYHIMPQKQTRRTKKKARRKSTPAKVYPKCIYCQTELTKRKRSKEHVVNRSILPKDTHKLTLTEKVCRDCNEGFAEIDRAFVESAITGVNKTLMDIENDENRWNETQEPFVIKDLSVTIKGDKQVFTVETKGEPEKNIFRGIAKIALNALIYDLKGEESESFTDKQGKCHYTCARNGDIFNGNEEELSEIKKFIKEGGKFPIRMPYGRIYDTDMGIQEGKIPMPNITDPTHTIVIHKIQSHYYAVISLFIGLDGHAPLYFVPLIGDINEIDFDSVNPESVEMVRVYKFGYLVKKESQQESVTSDTISIPEGSSPYIITPVDALEWIHLINMSKGSSKLLKDIEHEYRRRA